MKTLTASLAGLLLPMVACAQAPVPPAAPASPAVSATLEAPKAPSTTVDVKDCGDGCTRTITKTYSTETSEDGYPIVRRDIEVIELREGGDDVDVDVDVEAMGDDGVVVHKKVHVVTKGGGELTDEQRPKIEAMIGELKGGAHSLHHFHEKGDGVVIMKSVNGTDVETEVILSSEHGDVTTFGRNVEVTKDVAPDGTRTIRIEPEDGETMIITIQKEKSSKNDK